MLKKRKKKEEKVVTPVEEIKPIEEIPEVGKAEVLLEDLAFNSEPTEDTTITEPVEVFGATIEEQPILTPDDELSEEELIELYGPIPDDIPEAPIEHTIEEAVEGTLEEDKGVIIDETSN